MKRSLAFFLLFCACYIYAAPAIRSAYTPYEDARPILDALAEILPPELKDAPAANRENVWNSWVQKRDQEIRARLAQGDADSIINFLLFGVSFTTEPRFSGAQVQLLSKALGKSDSEVSVQADRKLFDNRVRDLVKGAMSPGQNERLTFVRKTMQAAGIDLDSKEGQNKATSYLNENTRRVLQEQTGFQESLAAAKSLNDATEEFAEVSKIYKDRGLSLDTSLPPDYALEVALKEMTEHHVLAPGSVKRIGIIGPGLDFTDKHEGLDFYPVQTVQPFAVADSAIRLGLAKESDLEVDVLDLSPRVLSHTERIASQASQGRGYTIQLPREAARAWKPDLVSYWKHFGDQIAAPASPVAPPTGVKGLTIRAVRVRPQLLKRTKAYDLNIVLQRAPFESPVEKFDLLVATNILVYYDTFEQSLALTNIAAMLKPGGFLLTNNLLLELPGSKMKSAGHTAVKYSDREADGDTIVRYRREP